MTRCTSVNKWLKSLLLVTAVILCSVIAIWLAGAIFLKMVHLDPSAASPSTIWRYYRAYGNDEQLMNQLGVSVFLAALVFIVPLAIIFRPKKRSLHGDATFATPGEIKKAGLFSDNGIIVGKKGSRYLIFKGSEHVLMDAPTRSGKGVGIVIPNLLSWPDSVVCLDIKQENWNITSGFRQQHGQQCYMLNLAPRDYRSHTWNALHYISDDPNFRVNDIQKISYMLFPDVDGTDPIWSASCRSLFLGIVLYLLDTDGLPVTLGEVYRQAASGDPKRFAGIIEQRNDDGNPLPPECVTALNDYLDTSSNTRSSIRKTFTSRLELFSNPVIDAVTSSNDFDLRDLRSKRMSIYVGITPDDLDRLGPLINLFFQQVIDLNTRELPYSEANPGGNPDFRYQCLLLMDEFAAIGRVNILSKGISYIAGYGLRMLPIIQSPAQLRDIYGAEQAKTFITNHALRVIFPPKDVETSEEISRSLGDTTVKSRSKTKQLSGQGGRSYSESDQRRALLLPQEIRQLGQDREIIILENCPPIQADKIRYYQDRTFTDRLLPAAEVPTVVLNEYEQPEIIDLAAREVITRPVTADDMNNIEDKTLDDFSCDFSDFVVPEGDISDDEMSSLVSQFFDKLDDAA